MTHFTWLTVNIKCPLCERHMEAFIDSTNKENNTSPDLRCLNPTHAPVKTNFKEFVGSDEVS